MGDRISCDREKAMKKALSMAGNVLVLASLIFLGVTVVAHLHEMPPVQWSASSVFSITGGTAVFCLGSVCLAFAWTVLLLGGNVRLSLGPAFILIGKSQIAKYLPGNVFHFVGRVTLGAAQGIPAEAIVLSMGVETVTLAATAAVVSAIGLAAGGAELPWLISLLGQRASVYMILFAILAVFILVALVLVSTRVRQWLKQRADYVHPSRIIRAALLYLMVFLMDGVVISWLVGGFFGADASVRWYQFAWGFSLAWLLGFIVPGAPGGIGIREAVFVGLFAGELGQGLAVGLAVLLRVLTSFSDLVTFGIAALLAGKSSRPA